MDELELARIAFFEGLKADELADVYARMVPRRFRAREYICRQGEPGDSIFLILGGLPQVTVEPPQGGREPALARLRSGDVVGEMSLISGEPRSASVVASVPTEAMELSREAFAGILARYPVLLANVGRILSRRLASTNLRTRSQRRGEAVALVVGERGRSLAESIVAATSAASPGRVAEMDLAAGSDVASQGNTLSSVARVLGALDHLLASNSIVITVVSADQEELPLLLEQMDRIVVVADEKEALGLGKAAGWRAERNELILTDGSPAPTTESVAGMRVIRILHEDQLGRDVAWLGRHLSRTKLGLALGAGGAKGYAHIGALQVLESAGYTVDYVAGSSIGAVVGAWLAMGMDAREIEATMRQTFSPETVAETFKLSFAGSSTGLELHTRLMRESTRECTFSDLVTPLAVMTVDLNTRLPAPITEGPVWQALVAATALAGLFPPYERGDQRLIDGLALVPVPVVSAVDAGADVTVSVNIMSRETLDAWPGESPPPPPPARAGARMLDTLLEVMDLGQIDASARSAALADVVVTPRFGPSTWRDFHIGDLFLTAGRAAAEQQLGALRGLAKPQSFKRTVRGKLDGTAAIHV